MQRLYPLLAILLAETALAHPGHGKPGFDHAHTLADLAVVLFLVLAVAAAGWALLRILRKKDW